MVEASTVLVTGGAGFVGSHLVDRLIDLGHRVVVVDDLSTGRLHNCNSNASFHHASVNSPAIEEIIEREQPDVVSHHAGQSIPDVSLRDPVKDAEINIQGSVRIIEACRRFGVPRLIFSSTADVYGEPEYMPCDEEHRVLPISPFGLSNHVVEQYLELYHRLHRMDYRVLRYSNVYGPFFDLHEEPGLIPVFTSSMVDGKQPRIFGTGEHVRDFVYVDDVIEANLLAMESGSVGTYNIGTGVGTSVNTVFELIKDAVHYRWSPVHAPARPGEVTTLTLDVSKAEKELGWRPKVMLGEGIQLVVESYRRQPRHTTHHAEPARSRP